LRPDELQQAFNFHFLFCPGEAARFRAQVEEIKRILPAGSWPTRTLSNHDFARHITRHEHGGREPRLAAVMLLALRGTPTLYYGEEIGMPNVSIARERWRAIRWDATDVVLPCNGRTRPGAALPAVRRRGCRLGMCGSEHGRAE
jgi:glycosidase